MYDTTLNSHIADVFEDKSTNLIFYELQDVLEWDKTKKEHFTLTFGKRTAKI